MLLNIAWQAMIENYHGIFPLIFNPSFPTQTVRNSRFRVLWSAQTRLLGKIGCCYGLVA